MHSVSRNMPLNQLSWSHHNGGGIGKHLMIGIDRLGGWCIVPKRAVQSSVEENKHE
jgi:hypothetical protein